MAVGGYNRLWMTDQAPREARFELHGRSYHVPSRPVVAVCIDGCADEYLDHAIQRGRMPQTARLAERGFRTLVRGALPSFTNVNNASICTGVPPSVHGIAGNFFLDPEAGEAVMMNDARYLRVDTILAAAQRAGRRVAVVSAKDKLRTLLGKDLDAPMFSAEKAAETDLAGYGIPDCEALVGRPAPPIYSGGASIWAMEAGAALLEHDLADFVYVTLSDYVQHKHAPDAPEALDFYAGLDAAIGRYLARNAVVGITADHGMNAKTDATGRPNVVWVEEVLAESFGAGACTVVCTITDPYVVHHGALGGFVNVHVHTGDVEEVAARLRGVEGILEVWDREAAGAKLELPTDRIGDLVVLGDRSHALGRTREAHDLGKLGDVPLRSHGSRYEELVPLLTSEPLPESWRGWANADPRSFDLFPLLCAEVKA